MKRRLELDSRSIEIGKATDGAKTIPGFLLGSLEVAGRRRVLQTILEIQKVRVAWATGLHRSGGIILRFSVIYEL